MIHTGTTGVERKSKNRVKGYVQDSQAVKTKKKADAKSETHQMAKDVGGYLCDDGKWSRTVCLGDGFCKVKLDMKCDCCGIKATEITYINGKKHCRTCQKGVKR